MSSHRTQRLLAYFSVPIVFCIVGYLLLWVALQPVWSMTIPALSFLVADEAPDFNPELDSIYDPNASKAADTKAAGTDYIPGEDVQFPTSGTQYGQITCEQIGLDAPVYWYDSDDILNYGAGQSLISLPPGFNSVIILSAHNTTFFRCLENAQVGNVIQFRTNYCDYEYTVTNVQVYNENDLERVLLDKANTEREELVLYTCYPFHAITGRKTDRLVVFADRTAGIDVKWRESQ